MKRLLGSLLAVLVAFEPAPLLAGNVSRAGKVAGAPRLAVGLGAPNLTIDLGLGVGLAPLPALMDTRQTRPPLAIAVEEGRLADAVAGASIVSVQPAARPIAAVGTPIAIAGPTSWRAVIAGSDAPIGLSQPGPESEEQAAARQAAAFDRMASRSPWGDLPEVSPQDYLIWMTPVPLPKGHWSNDSGWGRQVKLPGLSGRYKAPKKDRLVSFALKPLGFLAITISLGMGVTAIGYFPFMAFVTWHVTLGLLRFVRTARAKSERKPTFTDIKEFGLEPLVQGGAELLRRLTKRSGRSSSAVPDFFLNGRYIAAALHGGIRPTVVVGPQFARLPLNEATAVIAHELGHLREEGGGAPSLDFSLSFVLSLAGAFVLKLSGLVLIPTGDPQLYWGVGDPLAAFLWMLGGVLALLAGRAAFMAVQRAREYLADSFSAWLTSPVWMASALSLMRGKFGERRWYQSLWATHPANSRRIERLKRLAAAQRREASRPRVEE